MRRSYFVLVAAMLYALPASAECTAIGATVSCDTVDEAQSIAPSNSFEAQWRREEQAREQRFREEDARQRGILEGMTFFGDDPPPSRPVR
ncbi:MAG TPA: hypothetical protein VGI65_03250 [Steroidobacteraceae bacterium]|jgi:hypothetical protein